jgi:hypothetical protein
MTEPPEECRMVEFDDDIAPYRQPMVTSIGIIMGFLLAFLANWVIDSDDLPALESASDFAVAATLLASVILFTMALARLLSNKSFPGPGLRYHTTFRIYLAAIITAFAGLAAALML